MKRDCTCPRANHQHGTRAAYDLDGCRCFPCRVASHQYKISLQDGQPIPTTDYPDAAGVRRRLEALHSIGWSAALLGERLGYTRRAVHRYREAANVLRSTHTRIAALYDELWDVIPEGPRVNATRRWAAAQGFVGPLAWDDDEIDNPHAEPHTPDGGGWDLKPCGTSAAARRHYRNGEPLCAACQNAQRRDRRAA